MPSCRLRRRLGVRCDARTRWDLRDAGARCKLGARWGLGRAPRAAPNLWARVGRRPRVAVLDHGGLLRRGRVAVPCWRSRLSKGRPAVDVCVGIGVHRVDLGTEGGKSEDEVVLQTRVGKLRWWWWLGNGITHRTAFEGGPRVGMWARSEAEGEGGGRIVRQGDHNGGRDARRVAAGGGKTGWRRYRVSGGRLGGWEGREGAEMQRATRGRSQRF
jgi:hypothetical protein